MNGKDIFRAMADLDARFIEQAEFGDFSAKAFQKGRVRRFPKIYLLAAVIALLSLLVGCGIVYILNMQNLKLSDREWSDPYGYTNGPVSQRVITTGGVQGTVSYQAAKEWNDFEVAYAQTHDWDDSFLCPPEYEFYYAYSQEMVDKLDEITEKYGLKLIGPEVIGQSRKGMLDYLGIGSILLPEAPATADSLDAYYYEGGYLRIGCEIQMEDGPGRWPYITHTQISICPKDVLNNGVFVLNEPDLWEEWNYTTASGHTFLVLYKPGYWESYAICDRGDAMLCVYIQTAKALYTNSRVSDEIMSQRQVEDLLDVLDFSIQPRPGNPALLTGLPQGHDAASRVQTQDGYTVELKEAVTDGGLAWITLGITTPEGSMMPSVSSGGSHWGIGFKRLTLYCEGASQDTLCRFREQDDGDGLDNTVEYVITWTKQETEENLGPNVPWTLTLENLRQRRHNQEKDQRETLWESDAVWKFVFTFDSSSDYRALEFISVPTEVPAIVGDTPEDRDEWGTITVTAFTLRTHSASLIIEEALSYGSLSSWRENTDPLVVLRDGSTIALNGFNGFSMDESNTRCQENLRPGRPIPMEEVDHILLIDGTRLYPKT